APLSPAGPLVWTAVLLGASAVCFGLLAVHARVRERVRRPSILPLEVMREPAVRTGMALACLLFMMIGGFAYNYAILSQQGYGLAPWESGLVTAALAVAFVVASACAPRIVVRWGGTVRGGRRTLLVASAVQGAGLVGLGLVAIAGMEHFFVWYQVAGVLIGGGQGLMMGPLVSVVMAAVPDEAAGLTGGLVATAQQTGIGLGIAVLSTVFAGLAQLMPMTTAYGWTTLGTVVLTLAFALFAARIVEQAKE
ncbi:MAG TPA: MFS transporter, partial [Brevibacterium sp.]|nr:MFS transporter [Brevibacterium sp.]